MDKGIILTNTTEITSSNWQNVWQAIQVKASSTQAEVLAKYTPEISCVNRGTGSTENGIMIYEAIVLQILEFYGLEWNGFQIRELAEMMFSEGYFLQIAELKHFALKAKSSSYSQQENKRLAPNVVMGWFNQYVAESLRIRQNNFIAEADELRASERLAERKSNVREYQNDDNYKAAKIEQIKKDFINKNQSNEKT